MTPYNAPFEIHVHGDVPLREDVGYEQIQEALRPLWQYAGARSLAAAAASNYEDEPGIRFEPDTHMLQICWTVQGDEDFRQAIEEACMGLNDIAAAGAPLEVSFYDTEFDEEEAPADAQARDDFMMCFVGPTPAAIMQVQRDLLVEDVVHLMERHFDASELGDVVAAIDRLFKRRFDDRVNSRQIGRPPRGGHGPSGHGGPRKPRHLH
jgi:hypothetical protein